VEAPVEISARFEAVTRRIGAVESDPAASPGVARACLAARTILREARLVQRGWLPEVAVVLGSGLSGFEARVEPIVTLPFAAAGLPEPTVPGHRGVLVLGMLRGRRVAVLAGRIHFYEGHDLEVACAAVRAMALLGTPYLLASNAAGGLNPAFRPGDLMVISDHVNLMGANPLRGPNVAALGTRFPDMTTAYDPEIRTAFAAAAASLGTPVHTGVYLAVSGPTYETPAEIRAFGTLGADAVGMSTVPEVIAARHAGMRVGAVSVITNMAAGLGAGPLSHEDVEEVGASAGSRLAALFESTLEVLP
jgi:purine-nucleoside phosphorylase